ncbi:Cytochrome P450 [Melia azedarach]|uniref:Cytochrome P450 n=1 Tax=Melia azedarach TaxID=155640 RepID=A0ACC1YP88_MELAZ|nr:Cytochrome P450 [Melia azedarach]
MYGITSRAAFRNKSRDKEAFVSVIEETTKVAAGFNFADLFPSIGLLQSIAGVRPHVEMLHQEAGTIAENNIREHKKRSETSKNGKSEEDENLVDVLLRIQEHGDFEVPLSTDRIKAVISDIFGAGSETSATTLIVKATLRLHPPAPFLIPRECGERCEIIVFEIPVKTRVIVNAWAIGRDPKYWTDPDSFITERFLDHSIDYKGTNFEYIPFGSGRRICPGMSFGLASVEVSLAMLLYHFDWKLPDGMNHEIWTCLSPLQ